MVDPVAAVRLNIGSNCFASKGALAGWSDRAAGNALRSSQLNLVEAKPVRASWKAMSFSPSAPFKNMALVHGPKWAGPVVPT